MFIKLFSNTLFKNRIYVYLYEKQQTLEETTVVGDKLFALVKEKIESKGKELEHWEWISFNGKGYMLMSSFMPSKKPTKMNFKYWPFLFELTGELTGGPKIASVKSNTLEEGKITEYIL